MTSIGWPAPPPQPGLVPLRPLSVGELLSVGIRVAWRNFALIGPAALLIAALGQGLELALLAASGDLHRVVNGSWATTPVNPTPAELNAWASQVWRILGQFALASAVTMSLTSILVGPAAAGVAEATLHTKPTVTSTLGRLRGRWKLVIGTALLAGLVQTVGLILFVIPGIFALIILMPAVPVAALEGSSPVQSLRRSVELSRGFRGRIFGVWLLTLLFGVITGFVLGSLSGLVASSNGPSYAASEVLAVLAGAATAVWSTTVTALLYVDIRFRREGLAQALAASART